jgi:hypothetical protein
VGREGERCAQKIEIPAIFNKNTAKNDNFIAIKKQPCYKTKKVGFLVPQPAKLSPKIAPNSNLHRAVR